MEKSRAIDLLDNLIGMIEDNQDNDYDAAFRMAIDAIKAQLSQEDTTSDAISRQTVIDLLKQMRKDGDMAPWEGKNVFARIRELPSVQLEERTEKRTETHACDLISRQAALEKVRTMQTYKLFEGDDMILVDKADVQTELMMLPTAQPERAEGYWIRRDCGLDIECKCSACGYRDFVEPHDTYWFNRNFCPNCGEKKKGVIT